MKKQQILCPIDFSGSSAPAVSLAANLAAAKPSKIYLLHVNEPSQAAMSMDEAQTRKFRERIADQFLKDRKIEFEHIDLRGKPSEVIVDFAKKRSIDLIVMGTHGRTGLTRVVVGSVAQKVMTGAPCPVITVKMPEKPNKSAENNPLAKSQ